MLDSNVDANFKRVSLNTRKKPPKKPAVLAEAWLVRRQGLLTALSC